MNDLQAMLIMLAKTDETYSKKTVKMNSGEKISSIQLIDKGIEINFNADGSLHYFFKILNQ
jgi:hypothetical protein